MYKTVVKYLTIFLLMLIYINRGIFIVPYEIENNGSKEINTVVEWIAQLITGESNGIDEDGDMQNDCNSAKTVSYNFCQEFAQYLEVLCLHSKNIEKTVFPNTENIPLNCFYTQIDHPPQLF